MYRLIPSKVDSDIYNCNNPELNVSCNQKGICFLRNIEFELLKPQ